MFHMTFSTSHNRGKVLQLVYKQQQSRKFTYNYLYTIATNTYLINYLKYFQEVYELALWIKMLHMTYSPSHNLGIVVILVYKPQQIRKFTYNYLYILSIQPHTDLYLIFKILVGGVRISRLDQNVPHDFLSIPQPWESCKASVQATADSQIYL